MGWKGTLRSIAAAQRRAEREAKRRQRELERQRKHLAKMKELERAKHEVQVYENYIDVLTSIHKDSGEVWDWETIQSSDPPVKPILSDSNERSAQRDLDSYSPGIMDKMLKRVESKHRELVAAVEEGKRKDERNYQDALGEYEKNYADWDSTRELATRILSGDGDAYLDAIRQAQAFGEIDQLGSSIEFKIGESNIIEVTLHVNGNSVIPKETKTILKSGKLSVKKMTKTKFYELYQDYVCGGVLRVARELFALLPIEITIITAVGELLNTKTGHIEEQPILSVVIPRETLERLNFNLLDPSDSMDNFLHNMKFLKTKGFRPVDRILPSEIKTS